jgi:hypothetical protein
MDEEFKKRALAAMAAAQDKREGIPLEDRLRRVGICQYCGLPMRHTRLYGYQCSPACNEKRLHNDPPPDSKDNQS